MVQYHIQNLLNRLQPYIKPINSGRFLLDAEYAAWIDQSAVLSDAHKKVWKRAELPLLMSLVFPSAPQEQLRVSLEYMMLFLMLEQLTDTPATAAEAQIWTDVFIRAFEETLGDAKGPALLIKQLTGRIMSSIDDIYKPYLIASNVLLAKGMIKEALDREQPTHDITLEEYMDARRESIGARPFLDIGRWIRQLPIPSEVLENPIIARMELQTIDMISLANDLYSYKKEFFESKAHHNHVTVAMQDPVTKISTVDRQAALDYTCDKFDNILLEFETQRKNLPSFGEDLDQMVKLYTEVMIDLVVGNIQWSLICKRYGHTVIGEHFRDVVFDMDPL